MLWSLIFDEALPAQQLAVVTPSNPTTWGQLRADAERIADGYAGFGRRRIGLSFPPAASSYAAVAAFDRLSCDTFLLDAQAPLAEQLRLSHRLKLDALLVPAADGQSVAFEVHELADGAAWSGTPTVTILTSGTTGEPKPAQHSWESLYRPVRKRAGISSPRWLLTYRPNLYAGLQVMLQCFADHGTLAMIETSLDPSSAAHFMCEAGIQFVSATPSYWRRLLLFADSEVLKRIPLVQISLGGEVVDQAILDGLRKRFPAARLVHIYATTELGRCFSVGDGLAGFPRHYLDSTLPEGTQLLVRGNELFVRSLNSMKRYDALSSHQGVSTDWFATGDLVEVRADRVHFVGRRSEMINVGGTKVSPLEVERVIRTIPGVADVRVFGKASSITGQVVGCDVVPETGHSREQIKEEIIRICRAKLSPYQQPRLINFTNKMGLSAAGKAVRGGSL